MLHGCAIRDYVNARSAPYRRFMLSPATIAICMRLLNMLPSPTRPATAPEPPLVEKKNNGRKGKKKPATTPLNKVVYMPAEAEGRVSFQTLRRSHRLTAHRIHPTGSKAFHPLLFQLPCLRFLLFALQYPC